MRSHNHFYKFLSKDFIMISFFKTGALIALSFAITAPLFSAHPLMVANNGSNEDVLQQLPTINAALEKQYPGLTIINNRWREETLTLEPEIAGLIEQIYYLGILIAIRRVQAFKADLKSVEEIPLNKARQLGRKAGYHEGQADCAKDSARILLTSINAKIKVVPAAIENAYQSGFLVGRCLAERQL